MSGNPSDATTTWSVLAVVVGAADSPYLPTTLAGLAAQTRRPDRIVLAAVGHQPNADAFGPLVDDAGLERDDVEIVVADGAPSFGSAVTTALDHAGTAEGGWLWLLHDDSAPEPQALAELLSAVESSRSIAIAGAKQVDWDHPERLVSVGVRVTPDGQRFTGIEDGEVDQGQHDGRDDTYSVGTAGMLIEVALWRELDGPDPGAGIILDGRDVSVRARLAGRRVVVVPSATVRHARAGYFGLRDPDGSRTTEPRAADPRHSYRTRREAVLHLRLAHAPAALLPVLMVLAVLTAPLRALWRVATKEVALAPAELLAPLVVLAHPGAIRRSRRTLARTRRLPNRRLRTLQASWWDVVRRRQDLRMQAAAERRAARAPSELEMAERAAVARRRRVALGAVLLVTGVVALVTVAPTAFAGALIGGALLPVDASFGELWDAALSPWIAAGHGAPGPADPFLAVLGVLSFLTGGSFGVPTQTTIALLLVLAMPVAALGGWFAAGAATRSVLLRGWVALAWALGPALLLSIGQGRLGPVVAHLALPFVALGVVRALGLDRRDVIVSGMVGAQRLGPRASRLARQATHEARRARLAALADPTAADPGTDDVDAEADSDSADARDDRSGLSSDPDGVGESDHAARTGGADDPDRATVRTIDDDPADEPEEAAATTISRVSRVGSLGAAAAAGLAFAVATAGAPVLLPAGIVVLVVLAAFLGRRRSLVAGRKRLVLVVLPSVVVLGPVLLSALRHDGDWRVLFASPGAALASDPGEPWHALLGWPTPPAGLPFMEGIGGVVVPLLASGTILVAAVLALLRGSGRARVVRLAWVVVALGVLTAAVAVRVDTGIGRSLTDGATDEIVRGWAGPGTSLVLLGLLLATVGAADGLTGALAGRAFGWRHLGAAITTVVVCLGLIASATAWTTRVLAERDGRADVDVMLLGDRGGQPVPALGLALQQSPQRARVLALTATADAVDAQLWRGDGPQLTETSTVAQVAELREGSAEGVAPEDELAALVAALTSGTATDAPERLAQHAVAVVLVPPVDSRATGVRGAEETARARLVAMLDSVRGLDRVTENSAGVIWRVNLGDGATDESIVRARVLDSSGVLLQPLPSGLTTTGGTVGADGTERTLVLAERADSAWRATLDGVPLRAVPSGWSQAFAIPDGASGEIAVRYDPPLHTAWRILTAVILGLTVLLALPTRRRRLEDD